MKYNLLKIFFTLAMISIPSLLFAEDIYISQSDQGSHDGSSCANSHSAAWFNTAGNWGGGAGEIDAGDTCYLCDNGGDFTTILTIQGSGSDGSPITIKNGSGETPVLEGNSNNDYCIYMDGKSWIVIDGLTIQNADGNTKGSMEIVGGSADITIQNCTFYHTESRGIHTYNSNRFTILNNTFDTTTINNSNEADAIYIGGGEGPTAIYGNEFYTHQSGYYVDGLQTYQHNGPITIKYNYFYCDTDPSTGNSLQIQIEEADDTITMIGNVAYNITNPGHTVALNSPSADFYLYNNVFINRETAAIWVPNAPNSLTAYNNIFFADSSWAVVTGNSGTLSGTTWDYNIYYNETANNIVVDAGTSWTWATWTGAGQEAHGYNADPLFTNLNGLNFTLQLGSNGINNGTDLGNSLEYGLEPSSTWPNPTEADQDSYGSGWEIGAYVYVPRATCIIW